MLPTSYLENLRSNGDSDELTQFGLLFDGEYEILKEMLDKRLEFTAEMSDDLLTTMLNFLRTVSSAEPSLSLICSSDIFNTSNIIYLPIGTSTLIFFIGVGFKTVALGHKFDRK